MSDHMIDPNLPIDDIISALEKHHMSRIEFHKGELEKLRGFRFTNSIDVKSDITSETFDKSTFIYQGRELEISQKNVKELVFTFLKSNTNKLWSTSDIYDREMAVRFDVDGRNRKDWIGAISSSLNNLQSSKRVRSFENKNGRGNLYGINDPKIADLQDAINFFEGEDASETHENEHFDWSEKEKTANKDRGF